MKDILTIGVGGAAGEGVKKMGIDIGQFLCGLGLEVYLSVDYPSLIRGGHNFVRISAGKEKVWNDRSKLDILVCLNEETKEIHKNELGENAKIFLKPPLSEVTENLKNIFGEIDQKRNLELIDGNTALAKGLMAAGLDFYVSYPMTPATSILHYLASQQKDNKLRVIQPENEISAINMALGMVYGGKRAAVGTASGGFALMQEAFSFAGMAKLPLVAAVSQRQAPATGVPTHSSQSDLRFVIHAGHGEFPRIVLAPGDPEESFKFGAEALNLAWKFRAPAIVLLDKILSEHMMTVEVEKLRGEKIEELGNQKIPGMPGEVVKVTSYEHDEQGFTAEKSEEVEKATDARFEKLEDIRQDMKNRETVKIFGDERNKDAIVFFGSTKSAMLEASKYFKKPVKLIQIIWLEPFDSERVKTELEGIEKIICVEGNRGGQLTSLIHERTGIEIKNKVLRYDGRPFDPEELAEEINKKLWS